MLRNIVLIDDQYKNLIHFIKQGLADLHKNKYLLSVEAIKFNEYYKIKSLEEYDDKIDEFILSIPDSDKDSYCFLLDWQFIYNYNGVNKSEWHGKKIFQKLKNSGFNKILIFSNFTEEKEFKELLLAGGLSFSKPSHEILNEDSDKKTKQLRAEYFNYLNLLIESLFFDRETLKYGMIFGNSTKMDETRSLIDKAANSDVNVLILGESGTGKELTARAIHNLSERKNEKFLAINCGGIPSDLLETELFGYAPGTFTDQIKEGKIGLFREANGGTVLLDEIGDMPLLMQAKLLRFLQDHKVRPVGSSSEISVNIRIICSTNKNLKNMMEEYEESFGVKGFRSDLYWRIKVFQILLPSLEERFRYDNELPYILFFYYLRSAFQRNKVGRIADLSLSEDAYKLIKEYHWPGNFREYENVILSATAMLNNDQNTITTEILEPFLTYEDLKDKSGIDYLQFIEKGGSLKDIPRSYQKQVLSSYLEANSDKKFKTQDLIEVVLNEKMSSRPDQLKKQCARVTQFLNRNNIKLRQKGITTG